jgi:hypothetical protein
MSSPPSSSAPRKRGVQVPPHDGWTLQQSRVDQEQMVHGEDATRGAPSKWSRRVGDRTPTTTRTCRPCQASWKVAGLLLVEVLSSLRGARPARRLARSLARRVASGRSLPRPIPGWSRPPGGSRSSRTPTPSASWSVAWRRHRSCPAGSTRRRSGDGSCLGPMTRRSPGTGAADGQRAAARADPVLPPRRLEQDCSAATVVSPMCVENHNQGVTGITDN